MVVTTLRIATFNLYNLNLPGLAVYTDSNGWTQAEYDRKIAWFAHMLAILRADVIGLQELWHADAARDAIRAAGMDGDYELLAPDDARGTHIVCAALVRRSLKVRSPNWIVAFPEKFVLQSSGDDPQTPQIDVRIRGFSRPVLQFTIQPREGEAAITCYVCHFKSKGPTKVFREPWYKAATTTYAKHATNMGAAISTIRRTAEASALRYYLTEQMKKTDDPVIVMGDINDSQSSNTANILTEQPHYLVGDSLGGGDTSLYTAQTLQEYRNTRDVYYTHIHNDMMESLDHILVSQEFYDNSKKRKWLFEGLIIYNDHLNTSDQKIDGTTDHGVICATFRYKPIKIEARAIMEGGG